jgi:hypothetical protein
VKQLCAHGITAHLREDWHGHPDLMRGSCAKLAHALNLEMANARDRRRGGEASRTLAVQPERRQKSRRSVLTQPDWLSASRNAAAHERSRHGESCSSRPTRHRSKRRRGLAASSSNCTRISPGHDATQREHEVQRLMMGRGTAHCKLWAEVNVH